MNDLASMHAVLAAFVGWLLVFVPAWVFPYSWRVIGWIAGACWAASAFVADLWTAYAGQLSVPILLWHWFASPSRWLAAALGIAEGTPGAALVAVAAGLTLGLFSAWTGHAFRLFR